MAYENTTTLEDRQVEDVERDMNNAVQPLKDIIARLDSELSEALEKIDQLEVEIQGLQNDK